MIEDKFGAELLGLQLPEFPGPPAFHPSRLEKLLPPSALSRSA